MSPSDASALKVFVIPELLESILLHLVNLEIAVCKPTVIKHLFRLQRVSRRFAATIATSPKLQRAMFLRQGEDSEGQGHARILNPFLMSPKLLFPPCKFIVRHESELVVCTKVRSLEYELSDGELALQKAGSWRDMRVVYGASSPVDLTMMVGTSAYGHFFWKTKAPNAQHRGDVERVGGCDLGGYAAAEGRELYAREIRHRPEVRR